MEPTLGLDGSRRVRVLIVEDSPIDAGILAHYLRQSPDFEVVGLSTTARQAVLLAQQHQPELVLMDVNLSGDDDGFAAVDAIRTVWRPGIVFVTSSDDPETLKRITAADAVGFLLKPFDGRTLQAVLELARHRHQRDQQLQVLQAAVVSASIGIVLVDVRGEQPLVAYANPAFLAMARITADRVLGQPPCFLADPAHPEAFAEVKAGISSRTTAEATVPCLDATGRQFWSRVSVSPMTTESGAVSHILVFHKDVTEQRQAELALADSQRLELVGLLTAGLAHDMNNILAAIVGFAGLALADLPESAPHHRDIKEVLTAADRGRILIRKLMNFSRRTDRPTGAVDIGAVVHDVQSMVEQLIGKRARVTFSTGPEPMFVPLDRVSTEQVLLNLIANARDAMTEPGEISVTAEVPTGDGRAFVAGRYVRLQITDTGRGIPPEHLPKVFEPFFTSKPRGAGTGLGLATCRSLIRSAGGEISVSSVVGQGTTFVIELPRIEGQPLGAQPPVSAVSAAVGDVCLLVEDEPGLRQVCRRVLTEAGFTVIDAGSGEEAIQYLDSEAHRLALLVCDLVLPGVQGQEVIAHAHRVAPGLPVIVATGFAHDSFTDGQDCISVLWKPFSADSLSQLALASLTTRRNAQS